MMKYCLRASDTFGKFCAVRHRLFAKAREQLTQKSGMYDRLVGVQLRMVGTCAKLEP